ncbi:MAG: CesT family type III secretion system chaperone, partial [Kiritimatiellae bacterium]|nr:CesT family type III secretion system chaperone [Kiritimatiellia bacterium]
MDFNELIADFATRHNVDGLAAEDGAAALDVDGILVNLVGTGDLLAASAALGEPPAEGAGTFAELLLEASL